MLTYKLAERVMSKYVAPCQDCNKTAVLDEWCRCKPCGEVWWKEALFGPPEHLTDPDIWVIVTDHNGNRVDHHGLPVTPDYDPAKAQRELNERVRKLLQTKEFRHHFS
jgi:hypothetical protein